MPSAADALIAAPALPSANTTPAVPRSARSSVRSRPRPGELAVTTAGHYFTFATLRVAARPTFVGLANRYLRAGPVS